MISNQNDSFDLIPDYHHGLLDPETRDLFEKELTTNAELRGELREFIRFQGIYREIDGEDPKPSETVFRKISESIDAIEEKQQEKIITVQQVPHMATRLQQAWSWLKNSVTIPWGMALVQAAVIVILLLPGTNQTAYKTLGFAPGMENAHAETSYNVVFKDSAQESEIRELLLTVSGAITSGPSTQGRYVISLPPDKANETVVETLKQSEIIVFIEKANL